MLPLREIRRGDIIVFRYPLQPDTDFVKRVIGLPGDTVEVHDKVVSINGKPMAEPYVDPRRSDDLSAAAAASGAVSVARSVRPVHRPEGQYFAMGDNRDRSSDSRYWGTVPRSMIKGRAFMVYWSFEGTPASPDAPPSARIKELLGVAVHFFTKSRWERTFFIVDSKYHFTPGLTPEGEAGESP